MDFTTKEILKRYGRLALEMKRATQIEFKDIRLRRL